MKSKGILELAQDPRFISGIYNYCDRWCERCAFTSRCLNYALSAAEEEEDPAAFDPQHPAFAERLQADLQETKELLNTMIEERGIELTPQDLEEAEKEITRKREEVMNHKLMRAARHYAKLVGRWLETYGALFRQGGAELIDEPLKNAAAVILWDQYLIGAKLHSGLWREEPEPELDGQKSSDGSVKVSLLCLDRSIIAWEKVRDHFPETSVSIRPLIACLDQVRRETEAEFPSARSFIRPGFDTPGDHFVN